MHGFKMVSQYTYTNAQPASKALHVLSEMCQSYKDLLQMSKVHTGCACVCEREYFDVYEINDGSTCHPSNYQQDLLVELLTNVMLIRTF